MQKSDKRENNDPSDKQFQEFCQNQCINLRCDKQMIKKNKIYKMHQMQARDEIYTVMSPNNAKSAKTPFDNYKRDVASNRNMLFKSCAKSDADFERDEESKVYSDISEETEKITIEKCVPISREINQQTSNNQMANCVSLVQSLSRSILNKNKPSKEKARCLGSWVYTGPGFENEVIGKIEKDGVVYILNSTNDLIWHSVKCCSSSFFSNNKPKI